jgi:hypothetical protein
MCAMVWFGQGAILTKESSQFAVDSLPLLLFTCFAKNVWSQITQKNNKIGFLLSRRLDFSKNIAEGTWFWILC